MSRKKIDVNFEEFEVMCGWQCTQEEIAAFFKISVDALSDRIKAKYGRGFREVFKEKRLVGNVSVRRSQFVMSKRSPALLIWLGKQYLKQKEKITMENPEDAPSSMNDRDKAIIDRFLSRRAKADKKKAK